MNVFSPNDEIDVLVTCYPHSDRIAIFPQVRGFYLAQHLARAGLRAEFRQLPLPGFKCKVLICSEYQSDMQWFEGRLAGPFSEIRADRWFCLVDASLRGHTDDFSYEVCQWFASRGGVLCHLNHDELEPYDQVPKQILVPEATVTYEAGNGESLARALALATTRDPARIREQALQHFNFADVIARTRAAIRL